MPYDPVVKKPAQSTKIWRYMDLAKFLSLLDKESLFFCQARRFEDKYEGSWHLIPDSFRRDIGPEILNSIYTHPRGPRAYTAICCWHMSELENAGMWKLYATFDQGIAIQSTVKRLEDSMVLPPVAQFYMGQVIYEPPNLSIHDPRFNPHYMFFYKRRNYIHEQEFRVTIAPQDFDGMDKVGGIYVKVNLSVLIQKIHIAPKAPIWLGDLIRSITFEKYNINVEIEQSKLDDDPLS